MSPKWVTSAVRGLCAKTAVQHPLIATVTIMMMAAMIIILMISMGL